ncbi:oxidoreductase [Enterococcus raffinosus]|uniref:Oxidoreductase n=1 Tax=Enterococcus raffinosus TaxID=71452 RepID=A0AAW8TEU9_9ENTE|nr:oxidoreductase [Enterococcus raffinosus]MDT2521711.1 oxidoreductase [Enterococcus raffinosus]MDT2531930.1 oxidoreductase [Enterococcus raffinosus]MDT2532774.1 oxidoreductase [Enterococcus raffinosus]MDT2545507.1 oxidoreductase [Enterococcus raffinosus]MDT2554649.1 oxidoreductase [Enterococcus raffinosus]
MTVTMGFIGFGKSANRYHLPYITIRENMRVKKIFDLKINEKLAAPYREKGVEFTTDIDELLTDPEIELVTICTPAHTHYELAKKVIQAGKSVIVEKPFCDTLEHAKELFELGKEQGVLVMPYQNRRFDGDYLAVKQVVEQGFLGQLNEVETHIDYYRPGSITEPGVKENGSFYGLGIHLMDRMIALFGRPDKVAYDIRNNEVESGVDNYFDVDLHYGHTFKVKVKTNHVVASSYPRFILHGENGSFIKYGEDQQENDLKAGIMPGSPGFGEDSVMYYGIARYKNANGDWIEKQIKTPVGDYGRYYDAVYETLKNGAEPLVSQEEALTNIQILEAGFHQSSPSVYTMEALV